MKHVSRKRLKIPKTIEKVENNRNSIEDVAAVRLAFAIANHKKFNAKREIKRLKAKDAELERITQIPEDASDLIVLTKTKKLGGYIVAVTEKSPAKYRGTFVNRMQNKILDATENIMKANFILLTSARNVAMREDLQRQAIIDLKMCGYIALLAEEAGCILGKQYKQISIMIGECINLTVAWMKSDAKRWKAKQIE